MNDRRPTTRPCSYPECTQPVVTWCMCGYWCDAHANGVSFEIVKRHPMCDC